MLIVMQISTELPLEKGVVNLSAPDFIEALAVGNDPVAHKPSNNSVVVRIYVAMLENCKAIMLVETTAWMKRGFLLELYLRTISVSAIEEPESVKVIELDSIQAVSYTNKACVLYNHCNWILSN